MSVINRVLKDLDRKGAPPLPLGGVQAVQKLPATIRPFGWWPLLALGLTVVLALAWWLWPGADLPTASTPVTAAPREVGPEAPPRLRLSGTLSEPPPANATPGSAGVSPAGSTDVSPAGSTSVSPARSDSPLPAEPTRPVILARDTPLPVKLDTRLPEPRPPRILKEERPPSPREQAELAWRQAARLIEQGRGRDALEGLEATLRLDPTHAAARQSLIALSLEGGDTARGESLLREGLQLHAQDPWYARSLGQVYLQRGDTAQAAATLKAGLGKGVDAAYWGLYAGVLGKAGRTEDAVGAYREAARLNPAHGPWWLGLAVSLEQTGQRQEAAAAYQRALQTRLSGELGAFAAKKAAELQ